MSNMTLTPTATGTVTLPRVNLLPPEIAERKALQRLKIGLGVGVLASLGVVGGLYVMAAGGVSNAQHEVDAAQAQKTAASSQLAQLDNVRQVYDRVAAAQATLSGAMNQEVQWSHFLTDLSLTVPDHVWLTSWTAAETAVAPTGSSTAPSAASVTGKPGIGTLTVNGVAFSHDDVASWLESLGREKGFVDPYFTNSSESTIGNRKVVTFVSTATVTPDALSGRYTKPSGS